MGEFPQLVVSCDSREPVSYFQKVIVEPRVFSSQMTYGAKRVNLTGIKKNRVNDRCSRNVTSKEPLRYKSI